MTGAAVTLLYCEAALEKTEKIRGIWKLVMSWCHHTDLGLSAYTLLCERKHTSISFNSAFLPVSVICSHTQLLFQTDKNISIYMGGRSCHIELKQTKQPYIPMNSLDSLKPEWTPFPIWNDYTSPLVSTISSSKSWVPWLLSAPLTSYGPNSSTVQGPLHLEGLPRSSPSPTGRFLSPVLLLFTVIRFTDSATSPPEFFSFSPWTLVMYFKETEQVHRSL